MGLEQKSVDDIVRGALRGNYNVPEFQRGFVWRPDQVRDLIDSLYRDYPVGAMLVWDSSDYDVPRIAAGAQTHQWVVDGQQRITALCLAYGLKPYWWPDADSWNEMIGKIDVLANLEVNNGYVEFSLASPARRRDPNWFSVRRALRCENQQELTDLGLKVAAERGLSPADSKYAETLSIVSGLAAIRDRLIPLITMRHELEDVAEIFGRVNQAGTRVTEADVAVALVAASNPGWVQQQFLPYRQEVAEDGYDLEPGVYIRTITGIARGTGRLKDIGSQFWKSEVVELWPRVKDTVSHTIRLLQDRGILSAEILPSRNSLIPLFALHARYGSQLGFDRAFRWFLLANADGRYSASPIISLSQDLATIRAEPDAESALKKLCGQLRVSPTVDASRFLEDYARDRFGRLLVYLLLFDAHAVDWVSGTRIGFDRASGSLSRGFSPEWHHIFPRAILRAAGRSKDMDLLANITVLNEATNRNSLGAKSPAQYVDEFNISPQHLTRHFVPDSQLLTVHRYDEFITERAARLAEAANTYFSRLDS